MVKLNQVHHLAIICSDCEKSNRFYTEALNFAIKAEYYALKKFI